jgi:hypothetical protein
MNLKCNCTSQKKSLMNNTCTTIECVLKYSQTCKPDEMSFDNYAYNNSSPPPSTHAKTERKEGFEYNNGLYLNINDIDLIDLNTIIDNRLISTQVQFNKINEYFFKLKYLCLNKSQYQSQLVMLNTLFKLKYTNIKENFLVSFKQFQANTHMNTSAKDSIFDSSNDSLNYTIKNRHHPLKKTIDLMNVCALTCSKRFKQDDLDDSISYNNSTPFQNQAHRNYYQIERESLEYKYENILRSLNNEILTSIKSIYIQLKNDTDLRQNSIKQTNGDLASGAQQKRYTTETPIERKIRKKLNNSRPVSTYQIQADSQSNIIKLSTDCVLRYRNASTKETSV